jgi:predicted component of type VI protein secretion system
MSIINTLIIFSLPAAADLASAQGMPLNLWDANASTGDDWAKAAPHLKAVIEASEPRPGEVQITCVRGGGAQ